MRGLIMASMAALVLSGLPPAPLAPLPAQPTSRRAAAEDADAICAPFIEGFRANYDGAGYGRSGRSGGVVGHMPPPPPPPPPPVGAADVSAEEQSVAVTGSRVPQPNLSATSPVT